MEQQVGKGCSSSKLFHRGAIRIYHSPSYDFHRPYVNRYNSSGGQSIPVVAGRRNHCREKLIKLAGWESVGFWLRESAVSDQRSGFSNQPSVFRFPLSVFFYCLLPIAYSSPLFTRRSLCRIVNRPARIDACQVRAVIRGGVEVFQRFDIFGHESGRLLNQFGG